MGDEGRRTGVANLYHESSAWKICSFSDHQTPLAAQVVSGHFQPSDAGIDIHVVVDIEINNSDGNKNTNSTKEFKLI